MKTNKQLFTFLKPYDVKIQRLLLDLRSIVLSVDEEVNELIWDNYNALAIAYSKSDKLKDAFCHLAVYSKHVNLGFNRGSELDAGAIRLEGKGKLIRHLKVKSLDDLNKVEVINLLNRARDNALKINPLLADHPPEKLSKVMSISEKKLRPRN